MYQIEISKLKTVSQYITPMSSIYFACIIKKEADGIVWGSQMNNPDFILVWSPYQEGFQLMGQPLSKSEWKNFRHWFCDTIVPFLKEKGLKYFEYGSDTRELAAMFQAIFSDWNIDSDSQEIFHWKVPTEESAPPTGYEIRKVDHDLLKDESINKEFILSELIAAYGAIEPYFDHGIAYVAVKENEVVARADMLFQAQGYGNISVHTKEQHRKHGLSSCLVQKTIESTFKMGLIPIWDCTPDNIASRKTAEKCGFELVREDIISWFAIS